MRKLMCLLLLMVSCTKSPTQARKELAEIGVNYSESTFLNSISAGDKVAVDLFLQAGMNPNALHTNGVSALQGASFRGNTEIVKLLIKAGADLDAVTTLADRDTLTALSNAIGMHNLDTAQALVSAGADVNLKRKTLSPFPIIDDTYIRVASAANYIEGVQFLLKNGADVNSLAHNVYESKYSPLSAANGIPMATLLIKNGAKHIDDHNTLTSIIYQFRNAELIRTLLDLRRIDVNAFDLRGGTAIYTSINANCPECLKLLLNSGADPNKQTTKEKWTTPLQQVIVGFQNSLVSLSQSQATQSVEMVRDLIKSGARPEIKSQDGKSTTDYLAEVSQTVEGKQHPEELALIKSLIDATTKPDTGAPNAH